METIIKEAYEAPVMRVLKLQAHSRLCQGSGLVSRRWTYDNSIFSGDGDEGWDLPGYGDVIDF